jgi:predicted aminopeptidase
MKANFAGKSAAAAALLFAGFSLSGCYYVQAARGQLEVMQRSEPIAELVGAPGTPSDLAQRLRLIERAREFSITDLGLPDNDSYRNYADLERDFVVWNVFAAPEFSTRPKEWCFPVAGCVGYRGYFSEEAARRKADRLRGAGLDVAVGGVPAYSTLGRFDDPVLSTMLSRHDTDLVAMLFHELAHQQLYVKGDTAFNESFATMVEEAGIERWLQAHGSDGDFAAYRQRRLFREQVIGLVESARAELNVLYRSRVAPGEMRKRKANRLAELAADLRATFEEAGHRVPDWVEDDLNNARLASMALYHGRVPEFRALLDACAGELPCFYARSRELAARPGRPPAGS